MSVDKKDLGIDPVTGLHVFEVTDSTTKEIIGYDYVVPDTEE